MSSSVCFLIIEHWVPWTYDLYLFPGINMLLDFAINMYDWDSDTYNSKTCLLIYGILRGWNCFIQFCICFHFSIAIFPPFLMPLLHFSFYQDFRTCIIVPMIFLYVTWPVFTYELTAHGFIYFFLLFSYLVLYWKTLKKGMQKNTQNQKRNHKCIIVYSIDEVIKPLQIRINGKKWQHAK